MKKDAVDLLKQVLEIPSVNSKDEEGAVAEFLANYFVEHGIEASVQRIDDTHANVIAFVPGKDPNRTVIWNGH
ncbi:MAG: M20 family peptidase, partial [Lachnospiraceae bacterium]|nr:M20 family peptidase [Lachnospiraceae bacterium]